MLGSKHAVVLCVTALLNESRLVPKDKWVAINAKGYPVALLSNKSTTYTWPRLRIWTVVHSLQLHNNVRMWDAMHTVRYTHQPIPPILKNVLLSNDAQYQLQCGVTCGTIIMVTQNLLQCH